MPCYHISMLRDGPKGLWGEQSQQLIGRLFISLHRFVYISTHGCLINLTLFFSKSTVSILTPLSHSFISSSFKRDISHDARFSSKGLQTEKPQHEQVRLSCHHKPARVTMAITCLVLYRWWLCSMMSEPCSETNSKKTVKQNQAQLTDSQVSTFASLLVLRLLKQQLQDWKLAIQSEQSVLEDKYSGMEVSMETLRKHNMCFQDMLAQVNPLALLDTANHALLSQQSTPTKVQGRLPAGGCRTLSDSLQSRNSLF